MCPPLGSRVLARLSAPATAVATVLYRLGFGIGIRLEAGFNTFLEIALDQSLNPLEQTVLIDADQRYGLTFTAGTAGATDAVHIVFGYVGQLEVDHIG